MAKDRVRKTNEPPGQRVAGGALTTFVRDVLAFFVKVLDYLREHHPVLVIMWGVVVVLFLILVAMIGFGGISGNQRFGLALTVIAAVVGLTVLTAWRFHERPERRPVSTGADTDRHIVERARKCLDLMVEIEQANARILLRIESGHAEWARMRDDTYNNICERCRQRRSGATAPDPYWDTICAEPDVRRVCDSKWLLGEAVDDYGAAISRARAFPADHDDLEKLIRRSITQPDRTPQELAAGLAHAIETARTLLTPAAPRG